MNITWTVPQQERATVSHHRHDPDLLGGVTVLETEGVVCDSASSDNTSLYHELDNSAPRKVFLRLIPYYAWNNRGEPKMSVWLPLY